MEEKAIIYACSIHVDMAIDDAVNESEAAPEVLKVQSEKCSYCNEEAEYQIKL
ncbi:MULTISPECIES: CxxH/CxxC protein [unclassified Sedimentibacter]|uniref:CxxH/CxxC protein n=1 Tax=unclassified Sedimentibacter TaxID=2649220 RepID=UPI0027DF723B|nr:CxxH/CxxC protein [Sedimentibacter sp. MB35-C1]WMJ77813.1 CxxH/CxxC protein [Sedimentibacter sp. MB35-C1]